MTAEIQEVHLSFQCLLKIMQHSKDFAPDFVTGQLLGMGTDSALEISDSFPFSNNLADELEQEEYQIEMMKNLRESNVDTNTVGWYQTCSFDAFVSSSLTEAQLVYQSTIPNSVVLVLDTSKVNLSLPVVRAFQVRQNYHEVLLQVCTASQSDKFNLIFSEVPVKIQTSILEKIFLAQEARQNNFMALSVVSSPSEISDYAASLFASLIECADDSIAEVGRLQYSLRNIIKNYQSASRNKKNNDSSAADYLATLKKNNSGNFSGLYLSLCQIEQFEKLLAGFCEIAEDKLKLN